MVIRQRDESGFYEGAASCRGGHARPGRPRPQRSGRGFSRAGPSLLPQHAGVKDAGRYKATDLEPNLKQQLSLTSRLILQGELTEHPLGDITLPWESGQLAALRFTGQRSTVNSRCDPWERSQRQTSWSMAFHIREVTDAPCFLLKS
ncbi:uncharacterized protein ACOB8E_004464 isoform 2-T2 [Sarcophilus harrisii]